MFILMFSRLIMFVCVFSVSFLSVRSSAFEFLTKYYLLMFFVPRKNNLENIHSGKRKKINVVYEQFATGKKGRRCFRPKTSQRS